MTGVVFNIKKFALHDGPGIRTTIFLQGCPLNCRWCHNPESIREIPDIRADSSVVSQHYSTDNMLREILKDTVFYEESGGGVSFSGGEPLMQIGFLKEMLTLCKNNNVHTVVDTSGYSPYSAFEVINSVTDLYLYDIKLMNDAHHRKYTGISNTLILNNLKKLAVTDREIIIRVPLIPGITDTAENLQEISQFIKKLGTITRVDLLPFNELAASKFQRLGKNIRLTNISPQKDTELTTMKTIFKDAGFQVALRG